MGSDDVVIPVKSGGELTLVSLGGKTTPKAAVSSSAGNLDKAVDVAARPQWGQMERDKLRQIALSFFSDIRDRLETREELMLPADRAGLGLGREEADWMVAVFAAVRDGKPVPARPAEKMAVHAPVGGEAGSLPLTKRKPPQDLAGQSREQIFAALAKEIVDEVQPKLPDPNLRPRLEALIVTRFRDLRDANEARVHMKRDPVQGGLGLADAEIERLAAVLEERFAKIWKELHAQEKGRVVEGLQKETAVREQKRQEDTQLKEYESNQWYQQRFVRKPAPPRVEAPPPAPVTATPPRPRPEQSLPPSAPPPEVAVARPAPPAAAKPVMQDAEYRPKLLGPVEELASLTLAEFRRLARDPAEAARRIQDKIRLLEEEDYTQRAAAIAAWRKSEPVRKYLGVTRTMLERGIGPEEAAAEGTGPDALTVPEYNAIMELQNSLRY